LQRWWKKKLEKMQAALVYYFFMIKIIRRTLFFGDFINNSKSTIYFPENVLDAKHKAYQFRIVLN